MEYKRELWHDATCIARPRLFIKLKFIKKNSCLIKHWQTKLLTIQGFTVLDWWFQLNNDPQFQTMTPPTDLYIHLWGRNYSTQPQLQNTWSLGSRAIVSYVYEHVTYIIDKESKTATYIFEHILYRCFHKLMGH